MANENVVGSDGLTSIKKGTQICITKGNGMHFRRGRNKRSWPGHHWATVKFSWQHQGVVAVVDQGVDWGYAQHMSYLVALSEIKEYPYKSSVGSRTVIK